MREDDEMVKKSRSYGNGMLDDQGREIPDPVPMAPPVGYVEQPSMIDQVRQMIRSEHVRLAALKEGMETFEEADDFDVGDDFDETTPYEDEFDPVEEYIRNELREQDHRAKFVARMREIDPDFAKEYEHGIESKQRRGSDSGSSARESVKGTKDESGEIEKREVVGGVQDGDRGGREVKGKGGG